MENNAVNLAFYSPEKTMCQLSLGVVRGILEWALDSKATEELDFGIDCLGVGYASGSLQIAHYYALYENTKGDPNVCYSGFLSKPNRNYGLLRMDTYSIYSGVGFRVLLCCLDMLFSWKFHGNW